MFLVCFVVVNRGEFVVDCVVNVVFFRPLFRGLNVGQLFTLYFLTGQVERSLKKYDCGLRMECPGLKPHELVVILS